MNKQSTLFDKYVSHQTDGKVTVFGFDVWSFLHALQETPLIKQCGEHKELSFNNKLNIETDLIKRSNECLGFNILSVVVRANKTYNIIRPQFHNYRGDFLSKSRVRVDSFTPDRPDYWIEYECCNNASYYIEKEKADIYTKILDNLKLLDKIPGNRFNFDLYTYKLKAISDYQIELIITEKPTNNYINDLTADDCMDTVKFFKGGSDENN